MGGLAFIFPFFCCALFGIIGSNAFNISPKIFNINEMGSCPENNEMQMQYNGTTRALPQRNKYLFNGTIVVLADIGGPIEVAQVFLRPKWTLIYFIFHSCALVHNVARSIWHIAKILIHPLFGMCAPKYFRRILCGLRRFPTLIQNSDVRSERLVVSVTCLCRTLWTPFKSSSFKQGTYKLKDSTIDLSALSRLPFDGYTWILYMRFFAIKNREKIPTFCIRFEITVSLAKGKQTNHKWMLAFNTMLCTNHGSSDSYFESLLWFEFFE